MKKHIQIILNIFILLAVNNSIKADGTYIKKWITLPEVIKQSKVIFIASIIKTDHIWNKRRAYGRINIYVQKYRFYVNIQKVLLRKKSFPQQYLIVKNKKVWVERRGMYIPGRRLLIREKYRESFYVAKGKKGDKIIVYSRYASKNKTFKFSYFDKITMKYKVLSTIKANLK